MPGPEGHLSTDCEKSPDSDEAELSPSKAAEFTFVQVENKRGPRTAARSRVMREFWREKRLQKVQEPGATRKKELYDPRPKNSKLRALRDVDCYQPISGNRGDDFGSYINTREVGEAANRKAPRTQLAQPKLKELSNPSTLPELFSKHSQGIIPLSRTGIADVDPFSRLNVGEGPEVQKLLHHCHVFMGFTIHHMARLHGQKEPPIAIKHKMEGMRVINERFDDPAEALSDGNIGAVASFTSHELLSGNPEDFSIHMNGLDQMVKCRGGLIAFSGNRPLQLVIESSLGTSTIQYEIANMQARSDFCADFIRMVDGLERATAVVKDAASKIIFQEQWDKFSDRVFSEAIGMSWLHPTEAIEMLARVILLGERSKTERQRRAWYVANAMIELQDFGLGKWRMAESTLFSYLGSLSGKIEGGSSRPPNIALSRNLDICSGDYISDGEDGGLELFYD
ncbi:hypothetical protein DID88_007210 [Monilinia fructigena]|uniref:Uncharacterized protein n=1 Tax=Monilinia fructigena TaxID=38457 RepID=A0A395J7L9_9HELO|nr:hypothetical protein DID88_007210 [Monilinia fructigena]